MNEKFPRQVKKISGSDGFWRSSTEDTFLRIADKLLEKGLSQDEILDILSSLYSAVANEFGG